MMTRPSIQHLPPLSDCVRAVLFFAVIAVALVPPAVAAAQEYPTRPVTLIVPFPLGGPTDIIARIVAQEMSPMLGQPIVIENASGASGTVGAARAARAMADGYTLLIHHTGLASAETIYRQKSYDTRTAFAPIGLVSENPMVLVARSNFPPDTLPGLVVFAKAQRDWIAFGRGGIGTASHLCGLLFQAAIGAPLIAVGYRGSSPLLHDVLGGHVDLACESANATVSAIRAGRVKAYAVTTRKRLNSLPDLPTAAEAGLEDLDIRIWHGLFAPAGTPPGVLRTLSSALRSALRSPELTKRFANIGADAAADDKVTSLIEDIARWAPLLKAAGQYAD
jgi:tripartite-type tricarboxylate transporter receptor subunit TctC